MGSIKVLFGAVAAGALVGVLFAPAKGSVTRRRFALQPDLHADELGNSLDEVIDAMAQRIESVRGDVADLRRQLVGKQKKHRMPINNKKKGGDNESR